MFFVKNIPAWERWLRVGVGAALLVAGLLFYRSSSVGWHLVTAGVVATLTGFIGFCPMCALVGRSLKKNPDR